MSAQQFNIEWVDGEREPKCAPNRDYPNGKDIDAAHGAASCAVDLPYPAKRCGAFVVRCLHCGFSIAITTAGRPDDPRSVKIPCKRRTN